jgi:hypothetical protein
VLAQGHHEDGTGWAGNKQTSQPLITKPANYVRRNQSRETAFFFAFTAFPDDDSGGGRNANKVNVCC